jgi:hypothetical protein
MATNINYTIKSVPSQQLLDFSLNYKGVTLANQSMDLIGSDKVDQVMIHPGSTFDFTQSGDGADRIYLTGNQTDYIYTRIDDNTFSLKRGGGDSAEEIRVSKGDNGESDVIVFADGSASALAVAAAPGSATLNAADRSVDAVVTPGDMEIIATATDPNAVFTTFGPGVKMKVMGSKHVDTIYVKDGSSVDASNLGGGEDVIYMRGAWADYDKNVSARTLTLTRNVNGTTERIVVASTQADKLVFADGAVLASKATTALRKNAGVPITDIPDYDSAAKTPLDSLLAINNLDISNDTGTSHTDFITNIAQQTITGTLSEKLSTGDKLLGSVDNGKSWIDITDRVQGWSLRWDNATLLSSTDANAIAFKITRAAGSATFGNQAYTLDTTTLAQTVSNVHISNDTGAKQSDFITSIAKQTVTGTLSAALETDDILWGSMDDGANWTDITDQAKGTSITWTNATLSGSSAILFKVTDKAGNESGTTGRQTYMLDTSTSPIIATLANDTGTGASDRTTSNATVKIQGLEEGAAWYYSTNNGSKWTQGKGTSIADSNFNSGAITLLVKQTDTAGNESETSTLTFTLDTRVSAPTLALEKDTGIASDGITNNGTINISNLENGAKWKYSIDNGATWKRGSGTSIESSVFTSDRSYDVSVKQIDRAGNESRDRKLSFTLDTSVAPPTVSLLNNTGSSATDRNTSDGTLFISGIEDGATWQYSIDNSSWKTGVGHYINDNLFSIGKHKVSIKQTDIAGNTSVTPYTFTLEQGNFQTYLYNDTGLSNNDNITNCASLYITGLEGYVLCCDINGTRVRSLSRSNNFGLAAFKEGVNTVKYFTIGVDSAHSNDSEWITYTFTWDTIKPNAPSLALLNDTGSSRTDRVTNNGVVRVTGLETGAAWEYSVNDSRWITGHGQSVSENAFKEGENKLEVRQIDVAGNKSSIAEYTFTLDEKPPAAPDLALQNDTGFSAKDNLTRDGSVKIMGLETGASWWYSLTNTSGSWVKGTGKVLASNLLGSDGAKTVYVRQVDSGENVSKTASLSFTLDTIADKEPVLSLKHDTGSSSNDALTNNGTVNISGIASGNTWQYCINSGAWISSSGSSIAANLFSEGENRVTVRQRDAAGNESTGGLFFTLDTQCAPKLSLLRDTGDEDLDKITIDGTVVVSGIDDAAIWQYRIDQSTDWVTGKGNQIPASAFTQGAHTVYVQATDKSGNTGTTSLGFTVDTSSGPLITLKKDTGLSNSDKITSDGTVHFTFSPGGSSRDMYEYSINDSPWKKDFKYNVEHVSFGQGNITYRVREIDSNGKAVSGTSTFTFTCDSKAPATTPSLSLVSDTGPSNSDNISQNATIKITGLEQGARYRYGYVDNELSGLFEVTGDTIPNNAFSNGEHEIFLFQEDLAGNRSDYSHFEFTLDTYAPRMPGISLLFSDTNSYLTEDNLLEEAAVQFTNIETANHFKYSLDNGVTWTERSNITEDNVTLKYSDIHAGINTIKVYQWDAAGNISNIATKTFFIPSSPGSLLSLANDTGSSNSDNVTNDGTVNVFDFGDKISWEYSLDNGAHWTQGSAHSIAASVFHEGVNTVSLRAKETNASDYLSSATAKLTFTLDTTKPSSATPYLLHDTGSSNSDNATSYGVVVVNGLEEGVTWKFHTETSSEWVVGGKSWDQDDKVSRHQIPASSFTEGSNTIYIQTTDKAGNVSDVSKLNFTLNYKVPAVFLANDAGPSSRDDITYDADVRVVCHTSSTYEWSLDGKNWKNGNGYTLFNDFFHEGVNTLQVRETHDDGTTGDITPLTFTLDTKAPETPSINKLSDRIEITGLESDATWFYSIDRTLSRQGEGNTISADSLPTGNHHLYVYQQDVAGNLSHAYHFDVAISQAHTVL